MTFAVQRLRGGQVVTNTSVSRMRLGVLTRLSFAGVITTVAALVLLTPQPALAQVPKTRPNSPIGGQGSLRHPVSVQPAAPSISRVPKCAQIQHDAARLHKLAKPKHNRILCAASTWPISGPAIQHGT